MCRRCPIRRRRTAGMSFTSSRKARDILSAAMNVFLAVPVISFSSRPTSSIASWIARPALPYGPYTTARKAANVKPGDFLHERDIGDQRTAKPFTHAMDDQDRPRGENWSGINRLQGTPRLD